MKKYNTQTKTFESYTEEKEEQEVFKKLAAIKIPVMINNKGVFLLDDSKETEAINEINK